jgi:hypothetical protein
MTTSLRTFWGPAAAGVFSLAVLAGCSALPALDSAAGGTGFGVSPSPQAQQPPVPADRSGSGSPQQVVLPPHVTLQADGTLAEGVLPEMDRPDARDGDELTIRVPDRSGIPDGSTSAAGSARQTGPVLPGPVQAGPIEPATEPGKAGSVQAGAPSGPVQPGRQDPARPGAAGQTGAAQSGAARSGTADPGTTNRGTANPGAANPGAAGPGTPAASGPVPPALPAPGQSGPGQPAPVQPVPGGDVSGPVVDDSPTAPVTPPAQPATPPDACTLVDRGTLSVLLGDPAAALQDGVAYQVPVPADSGRQATGCGYAFGASGPGGLTMTVTRFADLAALSDRLAVEMPPLLARIPGIGQETVFETIVIPETGYRSYELTVRRGQDLYQFTLNEPGAPLYSAEDAQAVLAATAAAAGL